MMRSKTMIAAVGCLLMAGAAWAELPVQPGDVAWGLSTSDPLTTARQVRACASVGSWTSQAFVQSVEFDNYNGIMHNAAGNLLALNFGTATTGGDLLQLSTDGSDQGTKIFDYDGTQFGITLSRVGGLSVSPNNQYVACVSYDTGKLIVLEYNEGTAVGTGTGAYITNGWETSAAVATTFVTQGSAWYDNGTVLVYKVVNATTSEVVAVPFTGAGFGTPTVVATIAGTNGTASRFTDIEYDGSYVYCMYSTFTSNVTQNTLTVLDGTFTQVDQAEFDNSLGTAREIAMGPDGMLYVSAFGPTLEKIDPTMPIADDSSIDCFATTGSSFTGIDVAFGPPTNFGACCYDAGGQPTCVETTPANCANLAGSYMGDGTTCDAHTCDPVGACCLQTTCVAMTEYACTQGGGTYLGDGAGCDPNPCLTDMTIADARLLGTGAPVRLANVIVSSITDTTASSAMKSFHMQDATGGITVFGTNADVDAILGQAGEGARITLVGETDQYNGLFELVAPFEFVTLHGFPGVPAPILLTAADFAEGSPTAEQYESMLVKIECLTFDPNGGDANGNFVYGNITATDSTGALTVRISTNEIDLIGTPIPLFPVNVTGILSQFDSSYPYTGGYQLLVRSLADLTGGENCGEPAGGCCYGATCSLATEADCLAGGGVFQGAGTGCVPNPCVGACCVDGACTITLEAECTGSFLGNGTECVPLVCPVPVQPGDIALGLSDENPTNTAQLIRAGAKVGAWGAAPYLQSMEFDNYGGLSHNASGNLITLNYGAGGGTPGSGPSCTDPERPEEAGKVYNLATNGTNGIELIYDFNTMAGGIECTRIGGVSVSPDNQYLAVYGTDTQNLYVLAYDAGATPGTGSGAAVTNAWSYAGLGAASGTQGTAWFDSQNVLTLNTSFLPGAHMLHLVNFAGGVLSEPNPALMITGTGSGTSSPFTDVEYNPLYSPYIFCLTSNFTGGVSQTVLTVIEPTGYNPSLWPIVRQIDLSESLQTGREIALGNDGYLYLSQFAGSGTPRVYIDRIDVTDPGSLTDNSSEDYYAVTIGAIYSPFNGLDVALEGGGPQACLGDIDCDGDVDFDDIDPFVSALGGLHTECSLVNGDMDGDGDVDFDDIDPFVLALSGTPNCYNR